MFDRFLSKFPIPYITIHNNKILKQHIQQNLQQQNFSHKQLTERGVPHCNCRNRAECPMPDQCMNSNMVYRYQVKRLDNNAIETYTGSTVGFKKRHDTHLRQMEDERNGSTTLSSYVKSLRSSNVPYDINWNFKERAAPYNAVNGWCRLCTLECYHILFNIEDASLNQRSEFFSALLS